MAQKKQSTRARKATTPMEIVGVVIRARGFEIAFQPKHVGAKIRAHISLVRPCGEKRWRRKGELAVPLSGITLREMYARASVILRKFNIPEPRLNQLDLPM